MLKDDHLTKSCVILRNQHSFTNRVAAMFDHHAYGHSFSSLRYGPRQSEQKFGFSETGRLQCDVRLSSFAAQGMSKLQQVSCHIIKCAKSLHQHM